MDGSGFLKKNLISKYDEKENVPRDLNIKKKKKKRLQ